MSTAESAAVVYAAEDAAAVSVRRARNRVISEAWSTIIRSRILTDRLDATYGPGLVDGHAGHESIEPTVEDYRDAY